MQSESDDARPVLCVNRWEESGFVKAGQNGRSRTMPWVAIPTKHDGKGFARLSQLDPDGSVYGIWILIVAVAAKCEPRGALMDEDGPFDAIDIAAKIRRDVAAVEKAIKVLTDNKIRWLIYDSASNLLATCSPTGQDRTGQDTTCLVRPSGVNFGDSPGRGKVRPSASIFSEIEERHLTNEQALHAWFQFQSRHPHAIYPDATDEEFRNVVSLGKQAVTEAKRNPVGLFCRLVSGQVIARDKYRSGKS